MSRSFASVAVLVAVGGFFAGCLGADDAPNALADDVALAVPDGWWLTSIPSTLTDEKHDHGNRSEHANLTTANFHVIGWDPLVTESYGTTLVGMGCGGAVDRADGKRLAVVHSIATDVSFVVADITDPAEPMMMGEFYMPNAVIWDADITADGNHVLVGAYPYAIFGEAVPVLPPPLGTAAPYEGSYSFVGHHGAIPPASELPTPVDGAPLQMQYRSACTGGAWVDLAGPESYFPYGPGVVMVGIQDPATPTLEDWVPQPAIGPHSVSSALIDGTLYATASVTNLHHESSYYSIFEVVDLPTGGKLAPLSVIPAPGVNSPNLNGHIDIFISKHLGDGKTYGYLANAYGMYIYDLTNPRAPLRVSYFANDNMGSLHTTYTFPEMWGDKVYMIAAEEVGEPVDLPSGWAYILDITDPANPNEVGRWTLPVKPKWDDGGLMFSPHYVAVMNHTMFVSNYHGGLWAVDISDPTMPMASGLFVPDRESTAPFGGAETYGPSIEDVIVHPDGVITTWDGAGGVYNLHFMESMPGALAPPWGSDAMEHQH